MAFVAKADCRHIPYVMEGRGRSNIHCSTSLRDGIKIPAFLWLNRMNIVGLSEKQELEMGEGIDLGIPVLFY